jgi:WD40 repeat protein
MRIFASETPRPLNVLAVGSNGLVAAASHTFGVAGGVEVWNAARGELAFVYPANREVLALALHPNGTHLIFGRANAGVATVVDIATGNGFLGLGATFSASEFALSPDGQRLVVASTDATRAAVEYWQVGEFRFEPLWSDGPHESRRLAAPTFDPDRARIALDESVSFGRETATIQIRAADTGTLLVGIPRDPSIPVRQLAFTSDGTRLLVRTDGTTVRLFDAATAAPAGELRHRGRSYVSGMAVHPRGPVACARTDGTVTFWDVETSARVRTLDWKAGRLVSVAFSPDGALGAAGTEDGKIVVWDVDV